MQLDGDEEDDEEEVISLFLSSIVLHVKVLAAARTIIWHAKIMMKVFIVKEEEEVKLLSGGVVLLALYYYYLFEFELQLPTLLGRFVSVPSSLQSAVRLVWFCRAMPATPRQAGLREGRERSAPGNARTKLRSCLDAGCV